jgi:precorrin-2 dehydrogenase / sirohydrochlorin ferrochelatase
MSTTQRKTDGSAQAHRSFASKIEEDDFCDHTAHYPIFLSLRGRICLVVGGGSVGERKVRGLLEYGAMVKIIAADLTPWLEHENKLGNLTWLGPLYEPVHLDKVQLVFAATSDKNLNRMIAADADARGIWCNMATEPELGSFNLPAVFHQGPLSVAVGTSGLSPAFARRIRDKIAQEFGMEWATVLTLLGRLRVAIQAKGLSTLENQKLFKAIAALPLIDWIQAREENQILQTVHEICKPWLGVDELRQVLRGLW